MTNHSPYPFNDENRPEFERRAELIRNLADATGFRGALGEFPEMKMTPEDEGAIQFAIGEKDGKVVIDFGTPVHWLAMTPQQTADLASLLLKRAREVGRKQGETIEFAIG